MSRDILTDFNIVNEHPKKIEYLFDKVWKQSENLRLECYELYEETIKRMAECSSMMEELSNSYRNSRTSSQYANSDESNSENNNTSSYRDDSESDFYADESREKYARLEEKLNRLKQAKAILENVSDQVNNVRKKSEEIKNISNQCNSIFVVTVNRLIDLNRRG